MVSFFSRRLFFVALIVSALLVASCAFLSVLVEQARQAARLKRVTSPETGFAFPSLGEISRIRVRDRRDEDGEQVALFDAPEASWSAILSALSPSQYDPEPCPCPWPCLGELHVEIKNGRWLVVDVYYLDGESVGAFSIRHGARGAGYYRGGNSPQLAQALSDARRTYERERGKTEKSASLLEEGRRSRGVAGSAGKPAG